MTSLSFPAESAPTLDLYSLTDFSRLRRYPGFSAQDLEKILWADFQDWLNKGGKYQTLEKNGSTTALACLHPLEWDSAHFSMPMSRLQLLGSSHTSIEQYKALTQELLDSQDKSDGQHISVEVDIDNYNALNALTALGFEVLDLRRTYCTNRMRHDIDFVRMINRTRYYHPNDYSQVMRLVRETDFPSRFSRDPHLQPKKVKSLYEKWFHNLLADPNANAIVYERQGAILACGAIGQVNYAYAGLAQCLRTGSLYAGSAKAVGAYTPVLFRLIMDALDSHGLVDTTVSMNNVTVCKILEGFRSYKSAAAAYSLRLFTT